MQQLALIALQTSIFLTVFALGLRATMSDLLYLWRHPDALFRSLTAMNVVMPAVAVALSRLFSLDPPVTIALLVIAISPVPPFLPKKGATLGARNAYTIGLLASSAVLAIAITPASVAVLGWLFEHQARVPPHLIAMVVARTVLLPLAFGVAVRHFRPALAERVVEPVSRIAFMVLVTVTLLLLVATWRPLTSLLGNGTFAALAAFVIVGLMVGHAFGGPNGEDRTFLAIATASRHPGLALAVAHAVAPQQTRVAAAVLLYLLISMFMEAPYTKWRRVTSLLPAQPRHFS